MKRNKIIYGVIEGIILSVIALLAFTVMNKEYLFGWIAHNWKFYLALCLAALLLLFFNKRFVSVFMTGGITVGIFVGNYLGNSIKISNEGKIAEGMKAEDIWRLHHHQGFEIWIGIILISIVIGSFIPIVLARKGKNQ